MQSAFTNLWHKFIWGGLDNAAVFLFVDIGVSRKQFGSLVKRQSFNPAILFHGAVQIAVALIIGASLT